MAPKMVCVCNQIWVVFFLLKSEEILPSRLELRYIFVPRSLSFVFYLTEPCIDFARCLFD